MGSHEETMREADEEIGCKKEEVVVVDVVGERDALRVSAPEERLVGPRLNENERMRSALAIFSFKVVCAFMPNDCRWGQYNTKVAMTAEKKQQHAVRIFWVYIGVCFEGTVCLHPITFARSSSSVTYM